MPRMFAMVYPYLATTAPRTAALHCTAARRIASHHTTAAGGSCANEEGTARCSVVVYREGRREGSGARQSVWPGSGLLSHPSLLPCPVGTVAALSTVFTQGSMNTVQTHNLERCCTVRDHASPPANGLWSRTSPLAAFLFSSQNHTTASQSQNRLTIAQRLRVFGPGSVLPCRGHECPAGHDRSPLSVAVHFAFAPPSPAPQASWTPKGPPPASRAPNDCTQALSRSRNSDTPNHRPETASRARHPLYAVCGSRWSPPSTSASSRCQSSSTTVVKTGLASRRPGVGWTVASSESGLDWTGSVWSGLKTTDLVGELPTKELGVDESEDEWTTYSG
ncbi:hypothetical protein CPLU01_02305 [Colletotrichum plurivorum]|uniref:Uncharacterized protein n=1 Tax=Colletotrichum plurivorum TaxID=2175906 RepID=A0A8H6NM71_9PEZI|nr:hypothetical protein CPLU01_02305 [Colletotrichum plurivorum]